MKNSIVRLVLVSAAGFAGLSDVRSASAQKQFEAIPPSAAASYKFDFEKNFFPNKAAEAANRAEFQKTMKKLEALKGKVITSPSNLLSALQLNDKATLQFMKSYVYLYIRYATNTKNEDDRAAQSKLGAEFNERLSFLQQELMKMTSGAWTAFCDQKPALKPYAFEMRMAGRLKPHTLSLKEEELFSALQPLASDWQGQFYQRGLDLTKWAKIPTANGDLDVRRGRGALRNSTDPIVRKESFKKLFEGYQQYRDFYAFAMTRLVRSRNQMSQLHKYKDNPDEAYFNLFLTVPEVKGLYEKLAVGAETNKRFERLKAERVGKIIGSSDVNTWDMTVVPAGFDVPRFTIDEAGKVMKEATAAFGAEYAKELSDLLDPANGRLDIVAGDSRVPGAFSWSQPGSQISFFYSFSYEGYYQDVETMIHESGHAIHAQLMANHKVLPVYTSGPNYFTESFAMFNELLLGDLLYKRETNPDRKIYMLERLLDSAFAVYPIARQAAEEQGMYDGVTEGKLKSADDFDAMTKAIGSRFSIWFEKHPELSNEWLLVHHFFDQPMYYVNYVFAQMLALKYYELYQKDPSAFVPKYLNLVRNGFDAEPTVLLKKFLGIDIKDPAFVSDALKVVQPKLDELEMLYKK